MKKTNIVMNHNNFCKSMINIKLSKCPVCGYYAFNGIECFDCGYKKY
jgi:ribosomal protein L32